MEARQIEPSLVNTTSVTESFFGESIFGWRIFQHWIIEHSLTILTKGAGLKTFMCPPPFLVLDKRSWLKKIPKTACSTLGQKWDGINMK